MTYKIKSVHGHFEIYINGNFYCTADTMAEAIREVKTYENSKAQFL